MSEHIDIQNHRDGSDDYLKPDRLMTRRETAREFIDSEGGIRIDVSETAARHVKRLEPTFWPDYGIERAAPAPDRFSRFITHLLCFAAGMAFVVALILAAGRG